MALDVEPPEDEEEYTGEYAIKMLLDMLPNVVHDQDLKEVLEEWCWQFVPATDASAPRELPTFFNDLLVFLMIEVCNE